MTAPIARRLLALSLVLGIAANWLLNVDGWRAGFALWVGAALGVGLIVLERSTNRDAERRVLFVSGIVLAGLLVLRDAPALYEVDFLAFLVVCALIAWRGLGRSLRSLEPRDAVIGGLATAATVIGGAPLLALRDAGPGSLSADSRRSVTGFGLGAIAALPVLLIVTGLLASADPVFAGFVDEIGALPDVTFIGDVMFIGLATWVTAGAFRGSLTPTGLTASSLRTTFRLPLAAALPVLGGLTILLAAWVGLQFRILFGGAAYVAETAGMTLAAYARDGFFQLVVMAGIVLAVLLISDDVIDRSDVAARASFRRLGAVLVGLVGAVLVSAVVRLTLYVESFGLTVDRVLALAILVWVALQLSWFGLTVLRERRERFAPGVLAISAVWLLLLNAANPERLVVETNVARAVQGAEFDVAYHAALSADALPALRAAAARLTPAHATALSDTLDATWAKRRVEQPDWRTWSLPFAREVRHARTGGRTIDIARLP